MDSFVAETVLQAVCLTLNSLTSAFSCVLHAAHDSDRGLVSIEKRSRFKVTPCSRLQLARRRCCATERITRGAASAVLRRTGRPHSPRLSAVVFGYTHPQCSPPLSMFSVVIHKSFRKKFV